ncbi:MAG: TIGR02757 family protein [Bacteroidota bacterium]
MNLPADLVGLLNEKAREYSRPEYIPLDPVSVPHLFETPEDIEISGFLTATISWGQRPTIIKNAEKLVGLMPGGPANFLTGAGEDELISFLPFVHRTFNGYDAIAFLIRLQRIYRELGGLKTLFESLFREEGEMKGVLIRFREEFFRGCDPGRQGRHLSDVARNSAAKRLNMFLRWMVRDDGNGFDFGLWKGIPPSALMIPLDLHSGTVARELGLLKRTQNDWKAVEELTSVLRELDPLDPVKYDFALFGLGAYKKLQDG